MNKSFIYEKELSVRIWNEIRDKFDEIEIKNKALKEFISNSIEYCAIPVKIDTKKLLLRPLPPG